MKINRLLLPLLVSFLFALWTHRDELSDKYSVYDDAGMYYLLRAQVEPGSMEKDLVVRAFGSGALSGIGGVRLLSGFLLPVEKAAAKALGLREMLLSKAILLQTVTGVAAVALGRSLGFGGWAWGFLALFMAYFSSMNVFFGGLHREYAPLLCLALYYCAEKGLLAGALAVSAGFYAFYGASFPFSCCVGMLMLAAGADAKSRRYGWLLLAVFAAVPFILRSFKPEIIDGIGVAFAWKGSLNVDGFFPPEIYLFNANDHGVLYRWLTWGLAAASGAALILYRAAGRSIPRGDRIFFGAMALSFAWAWALDPGFSSRQVVYSLPLLLALFPFRYLAAAAPGRMRTVALRGMTALPLLAFFPAESGLGNVAHVSPVTMRAVAALPRESLVFTHPETARQLGFFTGRSPYSNERWETALCGLIQSPLCEEARDRFRENFEIYYSVSPGAVAGFAAASGVTHFLAEEEFYLPDYLECRIGHRYRFCGRSAQARAAGGSALLDLAREQGVKLGPGAWLLEAGRLKGPGRLKGKAPATAQP